MPISADTQRKMGLLEKHLLDFLEHDHGTPVNETSKALLLQAGRHLVGLFSTLRQLPKGLEKRVWDALAGYFAHRLNKNTEIVVDLKKVDMIVPRDPVDKATGSKTRKRTNK